MSGIKLKLNGTLIGFEKTLQDLPFSINGLSFWINGNSVVPMVAFPTERVDYLTDRKNNNTYTVASGTGRIGYPKKIGNYPILSTRFYELGSTSGSNGYNVNINILSNKYCISGITRRGPALTSSISSIFRVGNTTEAILAIRYYLSGLDFAIRRQMSDTLPLIRIPVDSNKFDWWLIEVDNQSGSISLIINGEILNSSLPSTGDPILPLSSSALICGRSSDQLRGQLSDLIGFNTELQIDQKNEIIKYLHGKCQVLNNLV